MKCSPLCAYVNYCTGADLLLYTNVHHCTQMLIIVSRCSLLYPDVHYCTQMFIIVPRCSLCADVHYCTQIFTMVFRYCTRMLCMVPKYTLLYLEITELNCAVLQIILEQQYFRAHGNWFSGPHAVIGLYCSCGNFVILC